MVIYFWARSCWSCSLKANSDQVFCHWLTSSSHALNLDRQHCRQYSVFSVFSIHVFSIQIFSHCSALINIQPLEELNANIWSVGFTQINCWANIVGSFSRCFSSIQDWRGRLMATLSDYVRVTVFVEIWNMNFWQRFRILRGPLSIHNYGQNIFWWLNWFPFQHNCENWKIEK